MIKYKFGNIIGGDRSNKFQIDKGGKVSVVNKMTSERAGKTVEKLLQSSIHLMPVSDIN